MRLREWVAPCLLMWSAELSAQSSPFVSSTVERALVNEVSGDMAFDNLRLITQWHRPGGSEGFFATARYVEARAREYGLEDVAWIDQAGEDASWTCKRAEAWLLEGAGKDAMETKLGSYAEVAVSIADYSRPADLTAELVDVGAGERAKDYEGIEVKGKIVLAYGSVRTVTEEAVWRRGAAGILSWASTRVNPLAEAADQIAWLRVPEEDGPSGEKTTFAFVISPRSGKALSDRLRREQAHHIFAGPEQAESGALRVRVLIESETLPENRTAMVEARIRGTDPSLPEVLLTAHLQEEKFSANDDGSGVVNVLEIGRTLTRLIREGKLPRPRRGIRFWWCDEIYSEYRYFADHPEARARVLCNLNQDMVGARQSLGGRIQYLARTPWTRPSFLSDVVESVLESVVRGNSAYLDALQAHANAPGSTFTRPIFSRLGSREPYHAQAVPYYDSTDHLVFNDAWIGVPGISLTNWPDEYIHSSADDLWQIDPTQLERNAYVIAASAWWIANADAHEVPALGAHLAARSWERLGRTLAVATEMIRQGKESPAERYMAAQSVLAIALDQEKAALSSAGFAGGDAERRLLEARSAALEGERVRLQAEIDAVYRALHGRMPPKPAPGAVETRLAGKVPRRATTTLSAWLKLDREVALRRRIEDSEKRRQREEDERQGKKVEEEQELHHDMQFEAMNLIDGKRDAASIGRFVLAEANAGGSWYYGSATWELVEKFFEKQAKDGLILW